LNKRKLEVSLAKLPCEGVWVVPGHQIQDQRARFDGRGERGDWRPELGKVAAAAAASGEELAGVSRSRTTVHQIRNREYREKEENETNSFPSSARPEKDTRSADHSDTIVDALGAREQGLRGHETERKNHREKEGEKEMLNVARSGAKTARNAERRAANGGGFRCLRKWSRGDGSEMRGGGGRLGRGRSSNADARGKKWWGSWEAGARLGPLLSRERREGGDGWRGRN